MQLYSLRSLATDSNNDLDMVTDGLRPFVDRLCEKGAVVTCHGGGGGVLPSNNGEGACRKISRTILKGSRILFYGRVPNSFSPLRGTNSTTTNYNNWHCKFS